MMKAEDCERGKLVIAKGKSVNPESYHAFLQEFPLRVARIEDVLRESPTSVLVEIRGKHTGYPYNFLSKDLIEVK